MDNDERGIYGEHAMLHGTPDYGENDDRTNAVDTIANVLHALPRDADARSIVESALDHYLVEIGEVCE